LAVVFNASRYGIGLTPVQLNNHRTYFGSYDYGDSFVNNSVETLFDENKIKAMAANNQNLQLIMALNKIPFKLNMEELQELKNGHCKRTRDLAGEIAKNLPASLRAEVNLKNLKDAAMLHDFGKVLIPQEVLNKPAALNEKEAEIMDLHSVLGYELLKNSGVNKEVLNLIKYHHNFNDRPYFDINYDVLNIADKYCALTEKRVYKDAMTPKQALTVLMREAKEGKINPYVFNALVETVRKAQSKKVVNIS